jgi:hypothetical protein
MSVKQPTQSNLLEELIDWPAIMPMSRAAGGHDEQMQSLFRGATVLSHWNEDDYQGMVATVVRLEDGRIAAYNDYYGSCSGCDSWEDATDDEVRTLCRNLANSAKIFDHELEAKAWLKWAGSDENYAHFEWQKCARGLIANWM